MKITFNKALFNPLFFKLQGATTRNVISFGGAGSSKSYSQTQHELIKGLQGKEKTLVIRKVGTTIKDSIRPLFVDQVIPSFGLEDHFTLNKSENVLTCKINGSQWLFRGLDDPEKIKSIAGITRIWIEEASELTEDDFDQLNLRLRGAEDLQMTMTFNPITEVHWIKKRFFDKKVPNTTIFKTTYLDNKFIDEEYKRQIDSYKEINPNKYRVYGLGEWGKFEAQSPFIRTFKDSHKSKSARFDPHKVLIISIDFNLDPFCASFHHIWNDDKGQHCHTFDQLKILGGSIDEMAEQIKDKYAPYLHNAIITGDFSGMKRDISQRDKANLYKQLQRKLGLNDRQFRVKPNPSHKTSRSDCNYFFHHFPDYKINPDTCFDVVYDIENVEADHTGKIIKSDRVKKEQQADMLDTMRYMINAFWKDWIDRHQKFAK